MAEIIQGQLTIVHKLDTTQPTKPDNPTTPKNTNYTAKKEGSNIDDVGEQGAKKVLGMTSIKRRLANYVLSGAERAMNRSFDDRIFKESLNGDRRSMKKIQNQKTIANSLTNNVKASVGSVITSVALNNPVIAVLHFSNMAYQGLDKVGELITQRQQFEERRSLELYETNRRRERVIVGTYNRR